MAIIELGYARITVRCDDRTSYRRRLVECVDLLAAHRPVWTQLLMAENFSE